LFHGALHRRVSEPWASAIFGGTLMSATLSLFPLLGHTPPPWRWPRGFMATSLFTHVAYVAAVAVPDDGDRRRQRWRPDPARSPMPETVVMKFGGTSVADAERLKRAARRIVAKREQGTRVVAVLSARGKETDQLIAAANEVSPNPDPREMDMLLSTGERVSCALCAMAINDLGHRAISLTGSQAGIVTDTSHTKARILEVRADRIRDALAEDSIVLVAGFQGVSTARDVTTLGRGGSDTTAVALAAAIGAEICEIYTD